MKNTDNSTRIKTETKTKPVVAIIGRPNVGKSTLFNRIIESRKAIVENVPGVTRDRIYSDVVWDGVLFTVIDTGGIVPYPDDLNQSLIREQVEIAIDQADVLIFLLDGKTGLLPDDREVLGYLRKCDKPIIYVVNKIDHDKHDLATTEFYSLGSDDIVPVSALHNRNIYELMDIIVEKLPPSDTEVLNTGEDIIKLTVLGKPNVGKSTLVNSILGEQRFITSPIPGTTRDAIDTAFEYSGKNFVIIDTAGIRKRSRIYDSVEKYSVSRAISSIERSDIVLFMIDGPEGPTHQDARLANLVRDRGKASIILLNKWDLAPEEIAEEDIVDDIVKERLKAIDYAPVLVISALKGMNTENIFNLVDVVHSNYYKKISTKKLNNFLSRVVKKRSLPSLSGKELKFYYITQVRTGPPTIVIFTNAEEPVPRNYTRFIENQLRSEFDFTGSPVRIIFRIREKNK